MPPRSLFTGILAFTLALTGCTIFPSPPPTALQPTPVPSAEAGGNNPTAAPPTWPALTITAAPSATETQASNAAETPASSVTEMPDPANYAWVKVVDGLRDPTGITGAGDGSERLFALEQPGRVRLLRDGQLVPTPFLDLTDRVGNNGSEQGLLGIAFHPKFAQNGYFYVNYTDKDGNTHISRFTASGDAADPASEKQFLFVQQPFANHNGGSLAFGPEGYLYIGLGDGGSAGDPYGNAQVLNTFLGKILRLDVDHGDPYAIPADNPYTGSGEVYQEIWASGLRNPWRFAFDRATGALWIGDVGQGNWEEIDYSAANTPGGLNFGWNQMEGTHPYKGNNQPQYVAPVVEYSHAYGCSVSGGYVYRGQNLPAWQGVYLYGDYCSGTIWGLLSPPGSSQPVALFQTGFRISTFGQDDAGELYVSDYSSGSLYRLEKR
jgi:glucose/arabinose dehydrogenase